MQAFLPIGSVSESPKLNALVDICEQAKNKGHKILIFSFFKDVISVIDKTLKDRSYGPISVDERILNILHTKKQTFNNFAKDSAVADQSNRAVDVSDKDIIEKIVKLEAERYGLTDKVVYS